MIFFAESGHLYPENLARTETFKDQLKIHFRPIKPSDEDMMRRLFYHFSDESKYLRYFARLSIMPHKEMQKYVNIDYEKIFSIVAILQKDRTERIIAEARYAYYDRIDAYEMAFIVDEEYHGIGLGTYMVRYIMEIAAARNIPKLPAYVHNDNARMAWLFEHAAIRPDIALGEHEKEYTFYLNLDVALNEDMNNY